MMSFFSPEKREGIGEMQALVKIPLALFIAVIAGGLVLSFIANARNAAKKMSCQNNLRQIGHACHDYHDANGYYPIGTVRAPGLPPDKRLSWLTEVYPSYMCGGVESLLDKSKPWDADTNCPPRERHPKASTGTQELLVGELRVFLCPANGERNDPQWPSPTHYVGVAGLGERAAELPLSDPHGGFFGYDRQVSIRDIKDGRATTMAVVEVIDGQSWTAGGWATVRGVVPSEQPYLAEGGQFASLHRGGGLFPRYQPTVTNVLFADGSLRALTGAVAPQVFESLATIAGGEDVGEPPP
jgi:hypothetical protein